MYLSALELAGFKSFAKHTRLAFEPGITCVVGPNGSGKSVIADAIRWVLGEQSLKSIRAKRSEDVIFAGSGSRARVGMAEVSLTLAGMDSSILDAPEVVITRRVDRGGEGEYFINGRPTRLFELAELLAKLGFAQKSYTVIPQGMSDAFVSASPQERRQMFEDATGVTPLLLKQERTQRKLEETKQQVLRARDLLKELEPRLRTLKRQAARARSRAEVETSLREAEMQYAAHRWYEFKDLQEQVIAEQRSADARVAQITRALEALTSAPAGALARADRIPELQRTIEELRARERELLVAATRAELVGPDSVDRTAEEITARTKEREKLVHELAEVQRMMSAAEKRRVELAKAVAGLHAQMRAPAQSEDATVPAKVTEIMTALRARAAALAERLRAARQPSELPALVEEAEQLRREVETLTDLLQTSGVSSHSRPPFSELLKNLEASVREERSAEDRLRSLLAREAGLKERIRAVEERLDLLQRQQAVFSPSGEHAEQGLVSAREALQRVREDLQSHDEELRKIQMELLETHEASARVEEERRGLLSVLSTSEQERAGLAARAADAAARRDDLLRDVREHLGEETVQRFEKGEVERAAVLQPDVLRRNIEQWRRKLLDIGGIDATVLDEESAVEQRVTDLHTRVDDLETAERNLREAMRELERHIHERFSAAFRVMNETFHRTFRDVFGGGRASLSLVKPRPIEHALPDILEEDVGKSEAAAEIDGAHVHELPAGVEIHAQPPGKKIQSVTQLSGGEKALTSIALLFAILEQRASPFVVLDEVDAALDESNSRRFARLLSAAAARTQFVVVTHNRATMEAARALYGVTMGGDGVSQTLSVRLEEAARAVESGLPQQPETIRAEL